MESFFAPILNKIDALHDEAATMAEKEIRKRVAKLAKDNPEYRIVFWQCHGHECMQISPEPYLNAPRNMDQYESTEGIRKAPQRNKPMMREVTEILKFAAYFNETFRMELGEIK